MSRQLVVLGTSVKLPDPVSVTEVAVSFQQQGGQLADLETTLQSLTRPDAWGDWTGLAADAFGQSIGQLPAELGGARDAYDDVASALHQYAGQLEPVVNSLISLSNQAEDAEGTLAAVRAARSRAIANGHDPVMTGWDARLTDATAAVSALRGQLNRLLAELTALAAVCTRRIKAAEPATARRSLFGEFESDFVRDVADPLGHGVAEMGKGALDVGKFTGDLLYGMLFKPFADLPGDLGNLVENPDLHNLAQLLGDVGGAVGAIGLVIAVIAFSAATLGVGDIAIASVFGAFAAVSEDLTVAGGLEEVSGGIGLVTKVADIGALSVNTGAAFSHEDDASWSDVGISALSVAADVGGDKIDHVSSKGASLLFDAGSGAEITKFHDGITYELKIPQSPQAAPGVVSGLHVTADAVQGLQGQPAAPAVQPAGTASVLQPAVSVSSPAVVNIQHVALSPHSAGAPGSDASGPGGDM